MENKFALSEAISLTNEILELLDNGNLDAINKLESERKILVEQSFNSPVEDIDVIKAQHLKNLNQQVVDKLNLFKQSVILELARLRASSKATRAYLNTDSDPK